MEFHTPLSRFTAVLLALSGHALLVVALLHSLAVTKRAPAASPAVSRLILVSVRVPRPRTTPSTERASERVRNRARTPTPGAATSTAITQPEQPTAPLAIDWRLEAERSAEALAPQYLRQQDRKCREPYSRSAPPPECKPRNYEPDWKPEPPVVGMQGLLPYVRLGKRCAVGLGFFGCGIGELPQADGTLLDDMSDPDRPRSSVPDMPK